MISLAAAPAAAHARACAKPIATPALTSFGRARASRAVAF